ncbi:NADH dehydrogenase [ubiquinone] 1 alpha subcomplex assembly factor 4 family-containing protein [Strongyloides ratti]|uniref:NADH dehydrogenase [ubiquinone] 1 alpha subcomplex assembly factor 4 family-containing protein n=1 Tax=Strongyloides ratti TaxID=34506 RepID=A0A090L9Q8_STRRB|nr:NADH dehydrogenase [ubiquinone] 1 alpha subcomplex assembly factor 4 family-containing protein [Strongyloides ratti]CEF64205.1 NADH dehydrogenase [ubiquinone] 1 alpha subcomplex assembly factor 4 family-containing protein [Strongyloides ratti]
MGFFKKLFNPISKTIESGTFQERVAFKFDKITKGEKIPAPKYETEQKAYENIMKDEKIKKEIEQKHETLVENMNKFNIKSTEVINDTKSDKQYPTRETEIAHKNDPSWEYFFYEPPKDKMLPNRLTLREALEILRTKHEEIQIKPENHERLAEVKKSLSEHSAVQRIDEEKLNQMWKYFRPFARSDQERVTRKEDLAYLQNLLNRKEHEIGFLDIGKRDPKTLQSLEAREKAKILELEEIKKLEEIDNKLKKKLD